MTRWRSIKIDQIEPRSSAEHMQYVVVVDMIYHEVPGCKKSVVQ